MKVFLTGATGFVGSSLVSELVSAGHEVAGLTRSEAGGEALVRAGATAVRGDVNDSASWRSAADAAEAVIHAAFNHDFTALKQSSEDDRRVIETLGDVLAGSERPLLIASGTSLARSKPGFPALETDGHYSSAEFPRAATEEAADTVAAMGVRTIVVRQPQVHDTRKQGRISLHVELARQHGRVAYVGSGENRLPAVHVSDAARLFRLALEHGRAGACYNVVAEEGIALREIAEAIGARLNLPVASLTPDEAASYFGPIAEVATMDVPASSALTRRELAWSPSGPDLLTDLRNARFDA